VVELDVMLIEHFHITLVNPYLLWVNQSCVKPNSLILTHVYTVHITVLLCLFRNDNDNAGKIKNATI